MNFSLRQLAAFCAVARHANFTRAAEELHVTQAGLSAMVREIESQLGVRLFERTTRRVTLTPAGERMLPAAQRALDILDTAMGDVRAMGALSRTRLRVGVTPLIASAVMPRVLRQLAARLPGLQVEVRDIDRSEIRAQVESGLLDLGLGAFFERESGMRREAILPASLMLAVPARQAGDSAPRNWHALLPGAWIALPADNQLQRLADRHLPESVLAGERRVVTHLETAISTVAEGLGQAVLPSFVAVAAARWQVRLVPLTPAVAFDYYSLERAGSRRTEVADLFLDTFVAVMRDSGAVAALPAA